MASWKNIFVYVMLFVACAMPFSVSAHATPVSSIPESSAVVESAPTSLSIVFSERIDAHASAITVTGPSQKIVSDKESFVAVDDPRKLSVNLIGTEHGTYVVSWGVVSSDDGHFTRGAFSFAVGAGQVVTTSASSTVEIVTIKTTSEVAGMTVELLGNGILWATLILFLLAIRPLLITKKFEQERHLLQRFYVWGIWSGVLLAIVGACLQILTKSGDLASLREIAFIPAVSLYIGTVAGSATLYRIYAIVALALIFFVGRKTILKSERATIYEWLLIVCMCVFAFMRAKISHATANQFYPDFSIGVNFFHLIEKDIWAGLILILLCMALVPRLRAFLSQLLPRAFSILAVDVALVSVTACYIVWLHLKSFENLFTTQWGESFLMLLVAGACVVGARAYHVLARLHYKDFFNKHLHTTLGVEFVFALLMIYFSSVVIITSPPLPTAATPIFSAQEQGVSIQLERDRFEDGKLMLTTIGKNVGVPTVTVEDQGNTIGPVGVDLSKRFEGGYVFGEGLLTGVGPFAVSISVSQAEGYDAQTQFVISKGAFAIPKDFESHRSIDLFTVVMLLVALTAFLFGVLLWHLSRKETPIMFMHSGNGFVWGVVGSSIGAFVLCFGVATAGSFFGFWNPYKALCEADGNMWHLMLPTKANIPVSSVPQEGCMAGMVDTYQFPDAREYRYYRALGPTDAVLTHAPENIVAGVPTSLTVRLKNSNDTPADLFVDMQKLVHMVIISKDESVFAHIHADDVRPLTKKEIETSTFTFNYTFPKGGEYLISLDYSHGLTLESKQFKVDVDGFPQQEKNTVRYVSPRTFGEFQVVLKYTLPIAGEVATLQYTITKDGNPVTDLVPYLGAAMHIAVVKNDFSEFIHTHGEVHPPGSVIPPPVVKNGKVVHTMATMTPTPPVFGPTVDAHLIFPTAGEYTVWGQFKVGDVVIPTSFTVRVE